MKKSIFFIIMPLLILLFGVGVWWYVSGVNGQLWMSSLRTITESTHQGANALNIQLEMDFTGLERFWDIIKESDNPQKTLELYQEVEPNVMLYLQGQEMEDHKVDETVSSFVEDSFQERGVLDAHISSITGESVFHIFMRGELIDGTVAYLVKEYRTKEVARQFTLTFYNNTGFSYLVNREGTIAVRPMHRNSNKTVVNLFDLISNEENEEQIVAQFRESVQNQQTGWAKFVYEEKGLVFCYEPLRADSNWLLVSIVPESMITEQATSILKKTMGFAGSAFLVFFAVVAIFYGIKMRENEKHTRELTEAFSAADRANRVKGKFLMDISHDILTPLNAIMGMTVIAQENMDNQAKVKDCLKKIKSAGSHLLSMVNDLLDLSQIEQGKMILKEEPLNLKTLFQEATDLMKGKAQDAHLSLSVEKLMITDERVAGDALRIRQVLLNIIGNAVKYTKEGGHVWLEFEQEEGNDKEGVYVFRCMDTGIGMDTEFMKRMFLPFERAKNTTDSKIAGTGSGLAITKSLLDLMNSEIFAESELGKGSKFTVTFRLKILQDLPEIEASPSEDCSSDQTEELFDYADRRILLVEDNELNMEIMEELLSITKVQIEKACDGQEAVQMVDEHPDGYYDLIFMDIQMPIMDGYEATRRIRKMDRCGIQKLPIYAVSANALANDMQNAADAGMDGHIAKPVDFASLEKVLKQYFG